MIEIIVTAAVVFGTLGSVWLLVRAGEWLIEQVLRGRK